MRGNFDLGMAANVEVEAGKMMVQGYELVGILQGQFPDHPHGAKEEC